MLNLSLLQIEKITHGKLVGQNVNVNVNSVVIDSRQVKPDSLFVAIKGEAADGHDYLTQAYTQGASAALVERYVESPLAQILVDSSMKAIGAIAREYRQQFRGTIISITGSSGKTSTKEMLVSILSLQGKVVATKGNQNNEIGVPLTVFNLDSEAQFAVVEMGAAQQGDISYLMDIVQPDVTVITNVGSAHIGRFGSEQIIAKTKAEIYAELKVDGKAVVNLDDKYSQEWLVILQGHSVKNCSLKNPAADIHASDIVQTTDASTFVIHYGLQKIAVNLSVPGTHNIANALCAAACALTVGCSLDQVASGIERFTAVSSRLQKLKGFWGGVLIDDCYNANPGSVRAAIDVLGAYANNRVMVLGDMAELGDASIVSHEEVGQYARQKGIDVLLTCGVDSAAAARAFGDKASHFANKQALIDYLQSHLASNDAVLVKGSRSAGLEEVVRAIRIEAVN